MFVSVAIEKYKGKAERCSVKIFFKGKLRIPKSTWFSWIKLEKGMRNFMLYFFVSSFFLWQWTSQLTPFSISPMEWKIRCCQSFQERHDTLFSFSYFFPQYHWHHHRYHLNAYWVFTMCQALRWYILYALAFLTLTAALWTRHPVFSHEKYSYRVLLA